MTICDWDIFERLLIEASNLSLDDYDHKSEPNGSLKQTRIPVLSRNSTTSEESSLPTLSRNSTLSSISTKSSTFSSNISYHHLRNDALHKPNAINKNSLSLKPGPIITNDTSLGPNGCLIPCKETHAEINPTIQPHFIVPVFSMTGEHSAIVMSTLFSYDEQDPFTPKRDHTATISWKVENHTSVLTLSQYTYQHNTKSSWGHLSENLGNQLGVTSFIVIVSRYETQNLYTLLDHLVHSIDQDPKLSLCSWWNRVILVVDGYTCQERELFLKEEMARIMTIYRLEKPLSVLFIYTLNDYTATSQRVLRKMMSKHLLCGCWFSELEDSTDSCDEMYTMATVIEYKDGVRKKPPKNEKPGC